jgi:hypothetical protein
VRAYLFSAGVSFSRTRKAFGSEPLAGQIGIINQIQTWDRSIDSIVAAGTTDEAQDRFQAWLATGRDDAAEAVIKKTVITEFLNQLLSESGEKSIDWRCVCRQAAAQLAATPADDDEQGYWVEINDIVAPIRVAATAEELRAELPEDVRDGLNWSPDKLFLFILSVLGAPAARDGNQSPGPLCDDAGEEDGAAGVAASDFEMHFPELTERQSAVLVEARNSVVAAWLWRRFAAASTLAGNPIQLIPWCGAIGIEIEAEEPAGEGSN